MQGSLLPLCVAIEFGDNYPAYVACRIQVFFERKHIMPVAAPTIATLTAGISFVDVSTGILAVAGLLVGVYVIWKGAKMIIHAVKGL